MPSARGTVMVSAIRNSLAAISAIALAPLNMLAKKVAKANLKMVRWAVRHESRAVYLLAVLWVPTLTVGLFGFLLASTLGKTDQVTALAKGLHLASKSLVFFYSLLTCAYINRKSLSFYLRHF
jgi:hypothetical protein